MMPSGTITPRSSLGRLRSAFKRAFWLAALLTPMPGPAVWAQSLPRPHLDGWFEKEVRPILAENCYSCHGPQQQMSSLRLDSRAGMIRGGDRGPSIVPGNPEESLLVRAVRHQDLKMPLGGSLEASEIETLMGWIRTGAYWPDSSAPAENVADSYPRMVREHWAFQPVEKPSLPAIKSDRWSRNPVDRFVLAGLEEVGLTPAGRADLPTLARRVGFVLTGLPPQPGEVERVAGAPTPRVYEELVDRLLSSPHFGENWARHWMDVVRFGETHGFEWNYEVMGAWRFRDYLIRAFNADVPFDQLAREQIAGDLLENPRINSEEGMNESLIGPAFYRLSEVGHDDCIEFREIRTDVVDNQIDTLTKAFQGLTVACARCHDHKMDPIPTEDYYALYGTLTSARQVTRTVDTGERQAPLTEELQELKPLIRRELATQWLRQCDDLPGYLQVAEDSQYDPASAHGAEDLDLDRLTRWQQALGGDNSGPEAVFFPWSAILCEVGDDENQVGPVWTEIAALYEKESLSRAGFNSRNYSSFSDFRSEGFAGWYPDGLGVDRSPAGEFTVDSEGNRALTGVLLAGVYTHVLSERLNGALRSPFLPKDKKFLSLRVMGGKLSAHRTIIDDCVLGEHYQLLETDEFSWVTIPTRSEKTSLPVYVELVTKRDNPRLPDRPTKSKKATPENLKAVGSYFGISRAVVHDDAVPPYEELTHMRRLFEGPAPTDIGEMAARYQDVFRKALTAWSEGTATDDDLKWVDWLVRRDLVVNSRDLTPALGQLIDRYRAIETRLSNPRVVHSMADLGPGYDFPLLRAGNAKDPGDPVPRGYLSLIAEGSGRFHTSGSGRLELAELITSAHNPLTARVIVNRVWHYVFGRGIVRTVDNFGRFGARPSHPELLDYLASWFVDNGWSVKKLIRLLVLSETFQQSSRPDPAALQLDPINSRLHHYSVRRLGAEAIRDAVLATSGRLDPTLLGPSIQPYRKVPTDYRKLQSGPLDGHGRRSIYLKVTRMEGPPFLELFDFPVPASPRGARDSTNVPSQALALLNGPFIREQASYWTDRLLSGTASSAEDRIDVMFRTALGREPEADEEERFRLLALKIGSLRGVPPGAILESREVWEDLAHTIFNLKEFIYLR